jgi:hypothetical protein
MAFHQLVNNSVYDRSGSLIGKVIRVEPLAAGDFTVVVKRLGENGTSREIAIDNNYIFKLDAERQAIHVNVETEGLVPQGSAPQPGNSEEAHLQLVEERLVVNRKRVKVGEVSVRRVIETEMVQVPIQREKLVIERIGESADPIEVDLNQTRLKGFEGQEPMLQSSLQADAGGKRQGNVASGAFTTMGDAIEFLGTVADLPDPRCEKIRVAILLQGGPGLKGTVYEFETAEQTRQKLSRLAKILLNQCSSVRLELFLQDDTLLKTYQDHIAQYAHP